MTPGGAHTEETRGASSSWPLAVRDFDQIAWLAFAAAAAAAAALILWFGRGASYSLDEIDTLIRTPGLDLGGTLEPHNGHFILTTRVAYWAILETFGSGYLPFRLLTLATVVLTAALFFAYASRRIGRVAALAPTLLLLLFGSHPSHLINGNGFTVLFAIACGLAALLTLERDDRTGEIAACALLCLGVATYTTALPFVVGVAVAILLREDRWRRVWIVVIPVVLYTAWWLQAAGQIGDPHGQVTLSNILLLPAWGFQSLSAVLGSVSGLDFAFGESVAAAGPALAVAALVALGWRISRGPVPNSLWVAIAIILTLWASGAVTSGLFRVPDDSRYLFSATVGIMLVAVWAAAGTRWTRSWIMGLYIVTTIALAANIVLLRNGGDYLRVAASPVRAALAGLDAAAGRTDPRLDISAAAKGAALGLPFEMPSLPGETAVDSYRRVSDSYGSLGYSVDALRGRSEDERALADSILIAALGIGLTPADDPVAGDDCSELGGDPERPDAAQFAPGDGVTIEAQGSPSEVYLRRFTDATAKSIGTALPARPVVLQSPPDAMPDPWVVSVSAPASVCGLRSYQSSCR